MDIARPIALCLLFLLLLYTDFHTKQPDSAKLFTVLCHPVPSPSPLIYRYIMDFLVDFAYKLIENPYFLDFLPVCGCWF